MLAVKADFVFYFFYIIILVDLSVFNSLCILKFKYYENEASIFGEGECFCFVLVTVQTL